MTNKHDSNYNLMEYFLNLLPILELSDMGMEQLLERGAQLSASSLPDATNLWIAHELMQFMDEMPGGFFIYRADGNEEIIYANKALLRIFQCKSLRDFRTWTNNSFRGLVHPDDLDAVEQSIQEQIAASQYDLDYVEYRITRRDGTVRWLEDFGHFIHTSSTGDFFYVFVTDATEKRDRQLEEKSQLIRESQQKEEALQTIIREHKRERNLIDQEHLRRLEVIEGLSMNYETILYADLDADKILPYRLSTRTEKQFENTLQMRSFHWYISDYVNTWVHPEDRALVADATTPERIRAQLAANKIFFTNFRILNGDEVQYLQLRIVNVGDPSHISQIVMGYRRVDEEFRQEMERNKMLEDALNNAKSAIIAKNTFLSNISHDMRTPLNALFGYTALAKKHIQSPDAALEYIEKIEASSRQLLDLINNVLELSWLESNNAALTETECSLPGILDQVYTAFSPLAQDKGVAFSLDLSGLVHPNVFGDGARIAQSLQNLVHNAITYTQSGGTVDLIARESGPPSNQYGCYQFQVTDSGSGIGQEFLSHIYESFAREHNTTASGIHGTGLGLTITKNIVERMGGQITVDSTVGKGTTFTVSLSLRIQESGDTTPPDAPFPQLQTQKILLVEDNEINMEIETELLQDLGFRIESAENGKRAVERIAASAPGEFGLILMDIQMPVMNGWEAAKAIRALEDPVLSAIPIIALSANAFESDKRTSQECGINAHLTKPFNVPLLLEAIQNIL